MPAWMQAGTGFRLRGDWAWHACHEAEPAGAAAHDRGSGRV